MTKPRLIIDRTEYGSNEKAWTIDSDIFHGSVNIEKKNEEIEVSGASFRFNKKSDLLKFIARLKQASTFYNKKRSKK